MKAMKPFLVLAYSSLLAGWAGAQDLRGYVFLGPAPNNTPSTTSSFGILPALPPAIPPTNNTYAAGTGLEVPLGKYMGAGPDLAGVLPGTGKILSDTVGTISANAYVHLRRADWQRAKTDVYGTVGYSLLFRDFTANGLNAGGGLNYWFRERKGLVAEFRLLKVFGTMPATVASQYYQVRLGLTFR